MIERKNLRFGVLFLIFLLPFCALAQKGEKIQTIVIDPGHGGKDTGALGKLTTEKSINLAVALKLGEYIEENLPDVKVIYTRKTDKFVELSERASIANSNDADVFISIHCNSSENSISAHGAETYIMGESKNEKNLNIAKKENASILLEESTDAYDNFDPNSTEAYIIFSLNQSLYQTQSLKLADKVQKQFANKVGRNNRGVQQAGFLVLWKTSMPSILVELGFISNMKEEQFLRSEKGQRQMALAMYRAFEEYKREFEYENRSSKKNRSNASKASSNEPKASSSESKVSSNEPKASSNESTSKITGNTYYSVQFSTIKRKISVNDPALNGVKEVEIHEHNGVYRYTSGRFSSKAEASKRLDEVRALGFNDAFITTFVNGERTTP